MFSVFQVRPGALGATPSQLHRRVAYLHRTRVAAEQLIAGLP
jgi:hypothetical protein